MKTDRFNHLMNSLADLTPEQASSLTTHLLERPGHTSAFMQIRSVCHYLSANERHFLMQAQAELNSECPQPDCFVFPEILYLDEPSLKRLLAKVSSATLVDALKFSSPELRLYIMDAMPNAEADALHEAIEARGPILLETCIQAQEQVLQALRELAGQGEIDWGDEASGDMESDGGEVENATPGDEGTFADNDQFHHWLMALYELRPNQRWHVRNILLTTDPMEETADTLVFQRLTELDSASLRTLLAGLPIPLLVDALKGCNDALLLKCCQALPKDHAHHMVQRLGRSGALRIADNIAAQEKVLAHFRSLFAAGEVRLPA